MAKIIDDKVEEVQQLYKYGEDNDELDFFFFQIIYIYSYIVSIVALCICVVYMLAISVPFAHSGNLVQQICLYFPINATCELSTLLCAYNLFWLLISLLCFYKMHQKK